MDKCTLQVLEWHITHLNVQAVIMIWLCQSRCIAKILYAKSGIDKVPYAKIPIDKIPYAESALCRNSNCPNALQPCPPPSSPSLPNQRIRSSPCCFGGAPKNAIFLNPRM